MSVCDLRHRWAPHSGVCVFPTLFLDAMHKPVFIKEKKKKKKLKLLNIKSVCFPEFTCWRLKAEIFTAPPGIWVLGQGPCYTSHNFVMSLLVLCAFPNSPAPLCSCDVTPSALDKRVNE